MYITWYGLGRAFIEMLRTDSLFIPGTYIRISMVIGFLCFAGGLAAMIVLGIRAKKDPEKVKEGAYYGKAIAKNEPVVKKSKKSNENVEAENTEPEDAGEDQPYEETKETVEEEQSEGSAEEEQSEEPDDQEEEDQPDEEPETPAEKTGTETEELTEEKKDGDDN